MSARSLTVRGPSPNPGHEPDRSFCRDNLPDLVPNLGRIPSRLSRLDGACLATRCLPPRVSGPPATPGAAQSSRDASALFALADNVYPARPWLNGYVRTSEQNQLFDT